MTSVFMGHALRFVCCALAFLAVSTAAPADTIQQPQGAVEALPLADKVIVYKAQRRMELLRAGKVLRTYRIALGMNPVGHKEREGDSRTPEGRYLLSRRNPRSDFFLSILVSYPNEADVQRARRNGWSPGGAIMIHGLPNELKHSLEYYQSNDWTDGCIAVSNTDMVEIWLMTTENTPIEIRP